MPTNWPSSLDDYTAPGYGWTDDNPVPRKRITDIQDAIEAIEGTGLVKAEYLFTETAVAAGTMTASVSVPAGSTLVDVWLHATAVFDSSGAVTAIVGDDVDDNGIFTGVNLKASDLTAGQTISAAGATGSSGGKEGADIIATHWNRRYLAAARVVSCIVTFAGTGGTAGRLRFGVIYSPPPTTVGTPTYAAA